MKQIITLIFVIYANAGTGQKKQFTEEEFIAVVKNYHPVAMQATIDIKIAEADITTNRSPFDPVLKMENVSKEWDGVTYYNEKKGNYRSDMVWN